MRSDLSAKEYTAWLLGALLIPAAEAAANCSPVAAALSALLCGAVCIGSWQLECPKWLAAVRFAATIIVTSLFLNWTHTCWQGKYSEIAVPALLLLLAVLAAEKGEEKAARSVGILRYGIYGIIAVLLVSGIAQMETKNWTLKWRMQDCGLIVVLLLPLLGSAHPGWKRCGVLSGIAIVTSLAVTAAAGSGIGLYGLSKSLSFFGRTERMESVTAAAITLGFYGLLTYLLTAMQKQWEQATGKTGKAGSRIGSTAAFALYAARVPLQMVVPYLLLLNWSIIPLLGRLRKKLGKKEKSA